MTEIVIENMNGRKVPVNSGSGTLLHHLGAAQVDWMHACGGKGRCTTCKAIILEGMANTGQLTPAEESYRASGALRPEERLACQVIIMGSVVIRVPRSSQLPHIRYSL